MISVGTSANVSIYSLNAVSDDDIKPINDILQNFIQGVTYVQISIGIRRAVMKNEQWVAGILPLLQAWNKS